jgi:hypothetical protein
MSGFPEINGVLICRQDSHFPDVFSMRTAMTAEVECNVFTDIQLRHLGHRPTRENPSLVAIVKTIMQAVQTLKLSGDSSDSQQGRRRKVGFRCCDAADAMDREDKSPLSVK